MNNIWQDKSGEKGNQAVKKVHQLKTRKTHPKNIVDFPDDDLGNF